VRAGYRYHAQCRVPRIAAPAFPVADIRLTGSYSRLPASSCDRLTDSCPILPPYRLLNRAASRWLPVTLADPEGATDKIE